MIARNGQFRGLQRKRCMTMSLYDFELNCPLSRLPNISVHKNQLLLLAMARPGDRSDEHRPLSGEILRREKETKFHDNYQCFRENATYGLTMF